jgi:Tfp pilus assembly protein PilV
MWARARSQAGFTTVELLLAVLIGSVGVISLIGTFDVSRRVTTFSEMREAASHIAEQKAEELRALDYGELALNGSPSPGSSSDPDEPPYYLSGSTYRWNQKSDAPSGHTEPLVIDATDGKVSAAAETWSDGRIGGKVYRYVTCAAATAEACEEGPDTSAYKRVTVAVTVENALGPQKPILVQTLIGNPDNANGEGANPLDSPNTKCEDANGNEIDCVQSVGGTVTTWYLYDTPATTFSSRQEIVGSHSTHATVAATGTCSGGTTTGCPQPDLMGVDPPPAPTITPPLYNYSNEITGGTIPGGAVVRRDTTCNGTVTTTDNTKGHMWVTAPLAAPMTLTGDAAMNLSTQTFNGATADVTLCVAFYNVPASISNLVDNPPTLIGAAGYDNHGNNWPTSATGVAFTLDFIDSGFGATVPAGNRVGVRIWPSSSSGADLVVVYDHPLHTSFLQVNAE